MAKTVTMVLMESLAQKDTQALKEFQDTKS